VFSFLNNPNCLYGLYISVFFSLAKSTEWMEKYTMKFLGSVQVLNHKGSDVLCAAMQKVCLRISLTEKQMK